MMGSGPIHFGKVTELWWASLARTIVSGTCQDLLRILAKVDEVGRSLRHEGDLSYGDAQTTSLPEGMETAHLLHDCAQSHSSPRDVGRSVTASAGRVLDWFCRAGTTADEQRKLHLAVVTSRFARSSSLQTG